MTHLTIRIQLPEAITTWQIGAPSQAAALEAAKELAGPDAVILAWSRQEAPQW